MADRDNKPIDTTKKQTRRGYAIPRRIRELLIGPGNTVGGWDIASNGSFQSEQDSNGFRIVLDSANKRISFQGGVDLVNRGIPESDTGGMAIEHLGGQVEMEVSGPGVGSGAYAVFAGTDASIGIIHNELLGTLVQITGLPTSSAGLPSGTVWNDGGTLKIT